MISFSEKFQEKIKKHIDSGELLGGSIFGFWNTFFHKVFWFYKRSSSEYMQNISKWLNYQLYILPKELIDMCKYWEDKYADEQERIRHIEQYVINNFQYTPDDIVWKLREYWASAFESWSQKRGDCDDGAVLIYTLAINSGIDPERIYLVAGDVVDPGIKDPVGHCYIVFRRNDLTECVIDWCYYPTYNNLERRIAYRHDPRYYYGREEWGRCNHKNAYGDKK